MGTENFSEVTILREESLCLQAFEIIYAHGFTPSLTRDTHAIKNTPNITWNVQVAACGLRSIHPNPTQCAQAKVFHTLMVVKLLPLATHQRPWSHLAIDLSSLLITTQNREEACKESLRGVGGFCLVNVRSGVTLQFPQHNLTFKYEPWKLQQTTTAHSLTFKFTGFLIVHYRFLSQSPSEYVVFPYYSITSLLIVQYLSGFGPVSDFLILLWSA